MYGEERARLKDAESLGGDTIDRILETLDALDAEVRTPAFVHEGEKVELASSTLRSYAMRLRLLANEVNRPFLELTNAEIDDLMVALLKGSAGIGPSKGYTNGTAAQFESALKAFYRYHDDHEVDPEAIPVETQKPSKVDERDLWELDEIKEMLSVINSKHNEALFELLAYTGQRVRVIQTLRVKDVDPDKGETGRYYVNEEVEGLKNREGRGPLLGAQGAVRRSLQVHPTGEPNDALITCPPDRTGGATPGERITQTTIRQVLKRIADKADVKKAVHPHMFRHYFTTVAKRDFGMDDAYIKRLRGDAPGSNVMETTYSHLSDEDASGHAESQFTGEVPETALTPAAPCSVCGEMLQAGDKACSNCGAKRAPDAEQSEIEQLYDRIEKLEAEREIVEDIGAEKALAGMNGEGVTEADLTALAKNDQILAKLIELRSNSSR
ncbi:MAG: tyrosine-type recombinase/integrase [Halobacteriaceae archaeon]